MKEGRAYLILAWGLKRALGVIIKALDKYLAIADPHRDYHI
jgi:hypothetical protein